MHRVRSWWVPFPRAGIKISDECSKKTLSRQEKLHLCLWLHVIWRIPASTNVECGWKNVLKERIVALTRALFTVVARNLMIAASRAVAVAPKRRNVLAVCWVSAALEMKDFTHRSVVAVVPPPSELFSLPWPFWQPFLRSLRAIFHFEAAPIVDICGANETPCRISMIFSAARGAYVFDPTAIRWNCEWVTCDKAPEDDRVGPCS